MISLRTYKKNRDAGGIDGKIRTADLCGGNSIWKDLYDSRLLWMRQLTVFRKTYKVGLVIRFFEPLLYLFAIGLGISTYVGKINGLTYIEFIAPGILITTAMWAATYETSFAIYTKIHYQRTYEAILATPMNVRSIIIGEMAWAGTKAILNMTIVMLPLALMGLFHSPYIIVAVLVGFLVGLIYSAFGIIATSFIRAMDHYGIYSTFFIMPLFMFSGVFYPIENLPGVLSFFVYLTPLYHGVEAARLLSVGDLGIMLHVVYLLVMVVLLVPLALHRISGRIVTA